MIRAVSTCVQTAKYWVMHQLYLSLIIVCRAKHNLGFRDLLGRHTILCQKVRTIQSEFRSDFYGEMSCLQNLPPCVHRCACGKERWTSQIGGCRLQRLGVVESDKVSHLGYCA